MNRALRQEEPHQSAAVLSDSFIDWWFNPWSYADVEGRSSGCATALSSLTASDTLARRDAYHLWCTELKVVAELPPSFDPAWSFAATADAKEFGATLRLFGALVAACGRDEALLAELPFNDRKWCMSIASTQALVAVSRPAASLAERGALELKDRLEAEFYGLWSRLRMLLAPAVRAVVDMQAADSRRAPLAAGVVARWQRCWRLCSERAKTPMSIAS